MKTKKPTPYQIFAEIEALYALKPVGPFAGKTSRAIRISIDTLKGNIDSTSDEFNSELSDEERDIFFTTESWMHGISKDKPSEGWGSLVA